VENLKLIRLASNPEPWKTKLDDIFAIARHSLIFDNLAIYGPELDAIPSDVIYAKSIGRGKAAEADVTWGSAVISRVLKEKQIIIDTPQDVHGKDRLELAYILGLPIFLSPTLTSALVFIRYGGPNYSEKDQQQILQLADPVTSVLRQKYLSEFAQMLESEKSTAQLQYDFINTISHELRSPLGFIKGYTTTLLRDDTQWDRSTQIDFLQIIERESNNLTELIDNLLDSSRLQSGLMKFNLQAVRLDSLIRDEINRSLIADPGQKIELICECDIPAIQADARRLAQVFDNLLANALKYARQAPITVSLNTDEKNVVIKFADKGPGIPKAYLSKIFTRFFRVPENSLREHGSGLGLSICKQIIELHQGSIQVQSDESGTIFTILLPLDAKNQQNAVEV